MSFCASRSLSTDAWGAGCSATIRFNCSVVRFGSPARLHLQVGVRFFSMFVHVLGGGNKRILRVFALWRKSCAEGVRSKVFWVVRLGDRRRGPFWDLRLSSSSSSSYHFTTKFALLEPNYQPKFHPKTTRASSIHPMKAHVERSKLH